LEDRRPASNADPYKIIYQLCESIKNAEAINDIKHKMNFKGNFDEIINRYNGVLQTEELLEEYQNDDNFEVEKETMVENRNNISTTEIEFNLNGNDTK